MFITSAVAQWKRAGLITLMSQDRNLAALACSFFFLLYLSLFKARIIQTNSFIFYFTSLFISLGCSRLLCICINYTGMRGSSQNSINLRLAFLYSSTCSSVNSGNSRPTGSSLDFGVPSSVNVLMYSTASTDPIV